MFEMSIVESSGALKSKSSRFVWITATFNAMVVGAMILVPLLYPEALPRTSLMSAVTAPPPPPHAAPVQQAAPQRQMRQVAAMNIFTAPRTIPHTIDRTHDAAPPLIGSGNMSIAGVMDGGGSGPIGVLGVAPGPPVVTVVKPKVTAPVLISSGVIAGNRLSGNQPVYPAIAKAAHLSGAVVLRAIISKTGEMERLTVISGPEMLRSSAVAAVQTWRYRPYLLNGEPTDVETTITVNFSLGG
ncbi:energy transducer TonB [Terriglobus roseus]|uniref:Protein TonB n=1 Tax=Terriglobus roseus TaxID=392734 RepID=A0A1G7ETU6_9BACT|nr:energy transducer TonB [Terriglobus roseus]SDE67104.1 protein TonB [Terriglobus roseus]